MPTFGPVADPTCVVQVIPGLAYGGLEQIATQLALALHERGIRAPVCTPQGGPLEEVLARHEVELISIPAPRPNVRGQLSSGVALAAELRRISPSVIHAHNPAATLASAIGRQVAGRRSVPLISTYHGLPGDKVAGAARILRIAANQVVACGPGAKAELVAAGLDPERVSVVPNAVAPVVKRSASDVRRELGASDVPLIVTVGRCVEQKNQALLLDAVEILNRRNIPVALVIVGVGPLEDDLRTQVAARSLKRVALVGARHDAADIIASADVFVLPSRWEGLPLAALEAMVLGRAVVGTRVKGIVDIICDGHNGLLVESGDAYAMADVLGRVIVDDALRLRLGLNAAQSEAEYSLDGMVDRYLNEYRSAQAAARGAERAAA